MAVKRYSDPEIKIVILQAQIKALEDSISQREHARFAMLASYAKYRTHSDVDGDYHLDSVPPGRYWLLSRLDLTDHPYQWFLPLTTAQVPIVLDLDNSNVRQHPLGCDSLPSFPAGGLESSSL